MADDWNVMIADVDKFGYYQIGAFKTYSKIEALQLAYQHNIFPQWIFNDHCFSCYDWSRPPVQSLQELYRVRAQQIRDRYDYLVIWYSGGADSFNVLDSFISNDIPVDEIAHCWSIKGDRTYETYFNAEIKKVAIPNTQLLKEQYPHIRHRVIDQTDAISSLLTGEMALDWIYHSNNNLSPNALARSYLRETESDYQDILNKGKKLAFVWGTDKPRVHWDADQQKFYCQFQDMVDNVLSARTQILARPWEHDEFFYWSPDCVELIIKQCHAVVHALTHGPDSEPWFSNTNPNRYGFSPRFNKYLTQHGIHRALYPNWDINTFQWQKTRSSVFGDRDLWYFRSRDISHNFHTGVEKYKQICLEQNPFDIRFLNTDRIYDGVKNLLSPRYYLS